MSSTLSVNNLAALGKNHSSTVAGQMSGLAWRGTSKGATAWAKICAAVTSSRIGKWFRANPLKGAVIGGAAIDGTVEAIAYMKSSNDMKTFTEAVRQLGYSALLVDLTESADYDTIEDILDRVTMARRQAAFSTATFTDSQLADFLAEYLGWVAYTNSNFGWSPDSQAKIDALCIMFMGLGIQSPADLAKTDELDFDAITSNALLINDTTTLNEFVEELANDYAELRTPVAPTRSRVLDFQSFVRFRLLNMATNVDLGETAGMQSVMDSVAASGATTVGSNGESILGTNGPLDVTSLIENPEECSEFYSND